MVDKDTLVSRIFLRSALPLVKVVAEEKPLFKKLFPKNGIMQFSAKGTDVGAYIIYRDKEVDVVPELHPNPDLELQFKSLVDLIKFFAGKTVLPKIIGYRHIDLLLRSLPLLLSLQILLPTNIPSDPDKRALKVKLLLYMVTNALSQLNKAGDEYMTKLTKNSPDRIIQWKVEGGGPAAYLRIKNGKSKAGRGVYTRRRPFLLMAFPDIEGAFKVLTSEVALVQAVTDGYIKTEGSMEHSKEIGYQMQRIEELTSSY